MVAFAQQKRAEEREEAAAVDGKNELSAAEELRSVKVENARLRAQLADARENERVLVARIKGDGQ